MLIVDAMIFLGMLGVLFGYCVKKHTFSEKIDCWGKTVKLNETISKINKVFIASLVVLIVGYILCIIIMTNFDWLMDASTFAIFAPFLMPFLAMPFGLIWGERWILKFLQQSEETLGLGEMVPLQVVDSNIDKVKTIEIFYDGIRILDYTGFAFMTILYSDYALGNFQTGKQLIMISTYFMQKYPFRFKKKYVENNSSSVTGNSAADLGSSVGNLMSSASGSNIVCIKMEKIN